MNYEIPARTSFDNERDDYDSYFEDEKWHERYIKEHGEKVREARESLNKLRKTLGVSGLIQAFQYNNDRVRNWASKSVAEIGVPAVIPLIQALNNEDSSIRAHAADALGKITLVSRQY